MVSEQSRTDVHPTFVRSGEARRTCILLFTDDRNYGSNGEKGHKTMNKTETIYLIFH